MNRIATAPADPASEYLRGLARAAGGAIIFALPLLMTMEMWWLGIIIERPRLLLLLLLLLPALAVLSRHAGFEETSGWREDARDAVTAFAVGVVTSAAVLWLFDVIDGETALTELVNKVSIQAVPASIGAMLARSQLAGQHADEDRGSPETTYAGELFIMGVGALFLAFSVAPTEEVRLLTLQMSPAHTIGLALFSLVLMHAFVYAVEFRGQHRRAQHVPPGSEFIRLTLVGYVLVLGVSGYLLWTFGHADGLSPVDLLRASIVLGFPASIGAAAARLIL